MQIAHDRLSGTGVREPMRSSVEEEIPEGSAGPAESVAIEVLHQSELTRVARYAAPDGTSVIRKEPVGNG